MGQDSLKIVYSEIEEAMKKITQQIGDVDEITKEIKKLPFYGKYKSSGLVAEQMHELTSGNMFDSALQLKELLTSTKKLLEVAKKEYKEKDETIAKGL